MITFNQVQLSRREPKQKLENKLGEKHILVEVPSKSEILILRGGILDDGHYPSMERKKPQVRPWKDAMANHNPQATSSVAKTRL